MAVPSGEGGAQEHHGPSPAAGRLDRADSSVLCGPTLRLRNLWPSTPQDCLAVSGAASVPAAGDLGELERRGAPGVVVEGRLDVAMRIEQHGRSVGTGSGKGADHRLTAVGRWVQPDVGEPKLTERVDYPLCRLGALLGRKLPWVGHGTDRHELG